MSKETQKTQRLQPVFDFESISKEQKSAERFVRRLLDAAALLVPDREWTEEDLREIIELAGASATDAVPVLSARQYRKRLREEATRADRYKQTFSTMIVRLAEKGEDEDYASVLDALIERLRKTDLVFLYKRHVAILLPHTGAPVLITLVGRIRALIAAVASVDADEIGIASCSYPSREMPSAETLLVWADGNLKE
jgi:hypothetical protein